MKAKTERNIQFIAIGLTIGVIIGMMITLFILTLNVGNFQQHNGLMYQKDCYMNNTYAESHRIDAKELINNIKPKNCIVGYTIIGSPVCSGGCSGTGVCGNDKTPIDSPTETNYRMDYLEACAKPIDDWLANPDNVMCSSKNMSDCNRKKFEYDQLYQHQLICEDSLK